MEIELAGHKFLLLPEKAMLLRDNETLIIADLHLGKAAHFRKSGISIPGQSAERDYLRLHSLIGQWKPKRVILLGDLFHSEYNNEWTLFCDFVNQYKEIEFILVMGNHDVMEREHYRKVCLRLVDHELKEGNIIYSHKPLKSVSNDQANLCGHLHPGIVLHGKGKQSIKLPCFYLSDNQMVLPAFGSLTGLYAMRREKKSEVYVIANDKVIKV